MGRSRWPRFRCAPVLVAVLLLASATGTDGSAQSAGGEPGPRQSLLAEVGAPEHAGADFEQQGPAALDDLGASLRAAGRPADAAERFQQAARMWGAAGDLAREAASHHLAALSLVSAGSFATGRVEYNLALEGFERIGDQAKAVECATNLASLLGRMGEYGEAEVRLRETLSAAERAGRPDLEQVATNSLANTLLFQGKHQEARVAYLDLLTELRKTGRPSSLEASVLGNLASSFYRTGQVGDALRYNQDSYGVSVATGDLEKQAVALNMRAILLDADGDLDAAIAAANEALALRRRIGDQGGAATTLANIGSFYGDKKYGPRTNLRRALDAFSRAADMHRSVGNLEGLGTALNNAGATLTNLGDYDRAQQTLEEARDIFHKIGNRPQFANVLGNIGYNFVQQRKYKQAIPVYEEGAGIFDALRTSILEDTERVSFFAGPANFFHTLVDLLMITGRQREAFVAAERARSRALLDLIASARPAIEARVPPDLRDRSREERQATLHADLRVRELAASGAVVSSPDKLAIAERDRDLARANLARTEQEIRAHVPDFDALAAPRILDVEAVQRELLGPDEALIAYAPHGRRLQVFVLTKGTFSARTEMVGEEALRAQVESFRRAIESRSPVASVANKLYNLLLAPDEAMLEGKRTLYVVGDGPLRLLPFEALATSADDADPRFVLLSRSYDVVYAHSVAVLAELRAARREAAIQRTRASPQDKRRPLLLFADPAYGIRSDFRSTARVQPPTACANLRLGELKGTEKEAESLMTLFGVDGADPGVNTKTRAQAERLRELPLRNFKYAHFAMHGVQCTGEGQNSWTEPALAFTRAEDGSIGLLRLEDVYSLRFDADLITLSACETALGQEVNGEGVLGLTRAFLFAGADSVVSSLWRVDDAATARLMAGFYGDMLPSRQGDQGSRFTTVAALQEAKRRLARETAAAVTHSPDGSDRGGNSISEHSEAVRERDTRHPFFWAAFILYGLPDAARSPNAD